MRALIFHCPFLIHSQDTPTKPQKQSSEDKLDTRQTGLEPSPFALSGSTMGPPPLLLQPTPPYEHTVDNIQNSTAQLSTVFSV